MATMSLCQYGSPLLSIKSEEFIVVTSWYGKECQKRKMAHGGRFNKDDPTIAAHKTLPKGTKLAVRKPSAEGSTGREKEIVVVIRDRGPFIKGRDLDLSEAAAKAVGLKGVEPLIARVIE